MKNIFKFIVFIIIFNNYVNLWSQNSTQTEELKIWVNALYVGENNQIHLPNLAQNGQKYKVKIIDYLNAQSILHNPNEISVFIPKKIKGELKIRFYIFENEKLIDSHENLFTVLDFPSPKLNTNEFAFGRNANLDKLKTLKSLNLICYDKIHKKFDYQINSIKVQMVGRRILFKNNTIKGADLDAVRPIFNSLSPGDMISLPEIRISSKSGYQSELESTSFNIGEDLSKITKRIKDSIANDKISNKYKIRWNDFGAYNKNVTLTSKNLTKYLFEFINSELFNISYFELGVNKYEIENNNFKKYVFIKEDEINKKDGFYYEPKAVRKLKSSINPNSKYDEADDTNFEEITYYSLRNPESITFEERMNILINKKEEYFIVHYPNRKIAIPVAEFLKIKIIFPELISDYLRCLKLNNKITEFYYSIESSKLYDSLSQYYSINEKTLNFFQKVSNFQFQKFSFKIITGSDKEFDKFYFFDSLDLKVKKQPWGNNIDWKNYKSTTPNYNPTWYSNDSIIRHNNVQSWWSQSDFLGIFEIKDNESLNTNESVSTINLNWIKGFDVMTKIGNNLESQLYLKLKMDPLGLNSESDDNSVFLTSLPKIVNFLNPLQKILVLDISKFNYIDDVSFEK
jgi:hypothetical protein